MHIVWFVQLSIACFSDFKSAMLLTAIEMGWKGTGCVIYITDTVNMVAAVPTTKEGLSAPASLDAAYAHVQQTLTVHCLTKVSSAKARPPCGASCFFKHVDTSACVHCWPPS